MINDDSLKLIAAVIDRTSRSLFNAIQYVYIVSNDDFYNINVKDILKIGLNDITKPDCFANLGISFDKNKLGEMNTSEFAKVLDIFRYNFAIRLPFIRRAMENCPLKDNHLKQLYSYVAAYGIANPDGIIEYDFKEMMNLLKYKKSEPAFDGEWFRRWIYTYGHELAAINNRNLFTLGCADAMFPLYYSALQEKITDMLQAM